MGNLGALLSNAPITAEVSAPLAGSKATGSFTLATAKFAFQGGCLVLLSTDRATLEGTARLIILG